MKFNSFCKSCLWDIHPILVCSRNSKTNARNLTASAVKSFTEAQRLLQKRNTTGRLSTKSGCSVDITRPLDFPDFFRCHEFPRTSREEKEATWRSEEQRGGTSQPTGEQLILPSCAAQSCHCCSVILLFIRFYTYLQIFVCCSKIL